MAYYEGEISPITTNSGNGNGGFGYGGDWIWAFLLLALFGWFGNGFGGNRGGSGSNGGVMDAYVLNSDFATLQRQIDSGFAGVTAGINQVNQGLCNGFYTQAQLVNGVQMQVANEFRGLDNAICTLGYNTQSGFNTIANQLASCCCDLRAGQSDIKYALATEGCATRQAIADSTNSILGFLTQEKISALQSENAGLKAQISNDKQSAYLVSQLAPKCPIPAFLTCNPYTGQTYTNGYGYGNCGCGASVQ